MKLFLMYRVELKECKRVLTNHLVITFLMYRVELKAFTRNGFSFKNFCS